MSTAAAPTRLLSGRAINTRRDEETFGYPPPPLPPRGGGAAAEMSVFEIDQGHQHNEDAYSEDHTITALAKQSRKTIPKAIGVTTEFLGSVVCGPIPRVIFDLGAAYCSDKCQALLRQNFSAQRAGIAWQQKAMRVMAQQGKSMTEASGCMFDQVGLIEEEKEEWVVVAESSETKGGDSVGSTRNEMEQQQQQEGCAQSKRAARGSIFRSMRDFVVRRTVKTKTPLSTASQVEQHEYHDESGAGTKLSSKESPPSRDSFEDDNKESACDSKANSAMSDVTISVQLFDDRAEGDDFDGATADTAERRLNVVERVNQDGEDQLLNDESVLRGGAEITEGEEDMQDMVRSNDGPRAETSENVTRRRNSAPLVHGQILVDVDHFTSLQPAASHIDEMATTFKDDSASDENLDFSFLSNVY